MKPLPTLPELAALHQRGALYPEEMVSVANALLEADVYSQSLAVLAGETERRSSDLVPLMKRALKELNVTYPDSEEAKLLALKYIARAILSGAMDPFQGAMRMWGSVITDISNGSRLVCSFVDAAVEIQDVPQLCEGTGLDPEKFIAKYKADIVEACKEVLKLTSPSQLYKS